MYLVRRVGVLLTLLCSTLLVADDTITFYTHSVSSAVVENETGQLVGVPGGGRRAVDVEIIRWILSDLGIENTIQAVPFKRALRKVQTEDNIAVFNVLRTIDRNKTMQWVGPIQAHKSYFYEAIDKPTNIRTVAEAADVKSVCVLSGNVHHTTLTKMGFENLVQTANYSQCVELLLRGRVDLMPAGEHAVFLDNPKYEGKITRTNVMLNKGEGYMGLSLNIAPDLIAKLQASLDRLKQTDDYLTIIKTYSKEGEDTLTAYSKRK